MSVKFEYVEDPTEFTDPLLKDTILEWPVDVVHIIPRFQYLAVYDRTFNYPTLESYRELLETEFQSSAIADGILNHVPSQQYGFGTDAQEVTVSMWSFRSDHTEGLRTLFVFATVIEVNTNTPDADELH